ncbi:MAG TPA: M18 family aminopeptidase [Polyangiales bacterium]
MSELAHALLSYIDASPTPYHAVAHSTRLLEDAGFAQLREEDAWKLKAGDRAYVVRGGSSVAAFVCGRLAPHEAGFLVIGAHTDSPNLRVKPAPALLKNGYRQLGVEVYGGALLHTWLDRDLSLAGRVVVDTDGEHCESYLVDFERPLLRVPSLAIHLNRNVNTEGLVLNAQTHLAPILGLGGEATVELRALLAAELRRCGQECAPERIAGWDLSLYDVQRATTAGLHDEFIQASRLDNLASCFAAVTALADIDDASDATRAIVLYDHEEVGSRSAQGAHSPLLREVLERAARAYGGSDPDAFSRAMARSFLISADMAHAVHPNYADRHEPSHQPVLGGGPVIKTNVNQAYATDGESMARFGQLCRGAEITPQHYVVRSDLPCGSTLGPITASQLGLRTVDVGSPLLSMHSIREMAAVADVEAFQRVLDAFFG